MIKNFFTKEWIEHQKMMQQYEVEHKKNAELQKAYDLLLDAYNNLKYAETKQYIDENEETN